MTVKERHRRHYLVAYDIGDKARYRKIHRCLVRWRADGQYSAFEVALSTSELRSIVSELMGLINMNADKLLIARLTGENFAPRVYFPLLRKAETDPIRGHSLNPLPSSPAAGAYLLAYDIRERKALQHAQRRLSPFAVGLQRSIYLYEGNELLAAVEATRERLEPDRDDFRVYPVRSAGDIWFLSGAHVLSASQSLESQRSWWTKLRRFLPKLLSKSC